MAARAEVIHYIATNYGGFHFPKTKICQAVWLADKVACELYGNSVAHDAIYKRKKYGIELKHFDRTLAELCDKKNLKREKISNRTVYTKGPQSSDNWNKVFSEEEIDSMDTACKAVCDFPTDLINNYLRDAYWRKIIPGQEMIPKDSVLQSPLKVSEDSEWD